MLVTSALDDPDALTDFLVGMSDVGQKLSEMPVVTPFELVLDGDAAALGLRNDVYAEIAYRFLRPGASQTNTEDAVEVPDVPGEPLGEIRLSMP